MLRRLRAKKVDEETQSNIKILQTLKSDIREVRGCYAELAKCKIANNVKEICKTSDLIRKEVSLNQSKLPKVNLFVQYYIPVLLKMLRQYIDIKKNKLTNEESIKNKAAIEDMLPKIQCAFTELLNQLFSDENRDVDLEIQVINDELKQRGLLNDGDEPV